MQPLPLLTRGLGQIDCDSDHFPPQGKGKTTPQRTLSREKRLCKGPRLGRKRRRTRRPAPVGAPNRLSPAPHQIPSPRLVGYWWVGYWWVGYWWVGYWWVSGGWVIGGWVIGGLLVGGLLVGGLLVGG